MRAVAHPKCARCGTNNPGFESERFNLRVCYMCLRVIGDWLDARDLIQDNPLAQELLRGVFGEDLDGRYPVCVKSPFTDHPHSSTRKHFTVLNL